MKYQKDLNMFHVLTSGGFNCLTSENGESTCETENVKMLRQLMVYGTVSGSNEIKMFKCNDDGNVTTEDGCPDLKKDAQNHVVYENVSLVMTKPIAKDFMEKINSILVKILNPTAPKLTTEEISVITQVKGPIFYPVPPCCANLI